MKSYRGMLGIIGLASLAAAGTGFEPIDAHRERIKEPEPEPEIGPTKEPRPLTRQQRRYAARKGGRGW